MNKRIHYIDNLRWMTVSLLILFHAAIAYNTWGEANYIFFEEVRPFASIVTFIDPWFMPMMFLLAGVSSRFSLQKRGYVSFMRERLLRLGIPLIFGLLVMNPVLSFIADITHNGYTGGYFEHYTVYFSRFTDLTGYDGGFTLGHFWFVLVLLVISFLSCPIIRLIPKSRKSTIITGIALSVMSVALFDVRFLGKPLLMFLCVYLLGYFVFSDRKFIKQLSRYKWTLTAVFLIVSVGDAILFNYTAGLEALNTICCYASFFTGILALTALGHDHLDFSNRFSSLNAKISYVFYMIHFPIVVVCQYLLSLTGMDHLANFFVTLLITYPLTWCLCLLIEKTKYIRVLFGMKKLLPKNCEVLQK